MMTVSELLTVLLLTVYPRDGIAPVYVDAVVEVSLIVVSGTACLHWSNNPPKDSLNRSHVECWPVTLADRTRRWIKPIILDGLGSWEIYVEVQGRDDHNQRINVRTPSADAVTK